LIGSSRISVGIGLKWWVHWKKTVEGRFHKDFPWDLNGDLVGFALW
jgi:uncharacterized protein YfiM (DUF2279 family)